MSEANWLNDPRLGQIPLSWPGTRVSCVSRSQPGSCRVLMRIRKNRIVLVASQAGGIGLVDVSAADVIFRQRLGRRFEAMVLCDFGSEAVESEHENTFGAVDYESHQLVVGKASTGSSDREEAAVQLVQKIAVCAYPHRVVFGTAGRDRAHGLFFVAGRWSQQISIITNHDSATWSEVARLDLPFVPGDLVWAPRQQSLFISSANSPQLGCLRKIDGAWQLECVWELPDTRLNRLAVSGEQEQLVVSCQTVNPLAHSTRNDVHWGLMVSNELRYFSLDRLIANTGQGDSIILPDSTELIGRDEQGKADPGPGCFAVGAANQGSCLAIEGTDELAIRNARDAAWTFIPVGKHPVALDVDSGGEWVAIANRLGNSLSIVDLQGAFDGSEVLAAESLMNRGAREIPLSSESTDDSASWDGERAFFDGRVSHDSWFSCNSCHVGGHTNGLLNDNFSDASFGTPKLVISALGRRGTLPLGWNGKTRLLTDQVRNSIRSTMQSDDAPDEELVRQLARYIESLEAPPGVERARSETGGGAVAVNEPRARLFERDPLAMRGAALFAELECAACHSGDKMTTVANQNVGLADEHGEHEFQVPSLLGVSQRSRFLHDGRADSLDMLFREERHQLSREMTDAELSALIHYLRWL